MEENQNSKNIGTSYQRLRRPVKEEFELELKKRIKNILINNYKA